MAKATRTILVTVMTWIVSFDLYMANWQSNSCNNGPKYPLTQTDTDQDIILLTIFIQLKVSSHLWNGAAMGFLAKRMYLLHFFASRQRLFEVTSLIAHLSKDPLCGLWSVNLWNVGRCLSCQASTFCSGSIRTHVLSLLETRIENMKSTYSCLQKLHNLHLDFYRMPHAAILCQICCTASPIFLLRGTARSKQPGRMECWPTWPDRELLFQRTWNPKIQKQMERSRGPPHDLTLHQTNSASLAFQLPHGPVGTTSGAHDEKIDVMKSGNTIQNKNRNFGIFRHHFLSSWNVIALPKVLSLWFIAYSILFAIDEQQNFPFLGWRTPHGNGLLEKLVEDYLHICTTFRFHRQPFKGAAGSEVWMVSDLTHLLSQLMYPHKLGSLANSEGTQSACQSRFQQPGLVSFQISPYVRSGNPGNSSNLTFLLDIHNENALNVWHALKLTCKLQQVSSTFQHLGLWMNPSKAKLGNFRVLVVRGPRFATLLTLFDSFVV